MKPNDLKLYDTYAKTWWDPSDKFFALKHLNIPRFKYFDRFVPDWKDIRVLDVGCGGGFTCEYLVQRGAHVSGIDQSQGLIDAAKAHAQSQGYKIDYRRGVGESLPFDDKSFDMVVCVDVLEHVDDVSKVTAEIARVLKPKGLFLFDTINRTFLSKIIMIWLLENLLKEIPKGVHDWKKFIKPSELVDLLGQNGFGEFDLKGLDIRGKDKKTGMFKTAFTDRLAVMYIGKCAKLER